MTFFGALLAHREETAINIAVACQLLWTKTRMHRTVIRLKETGDLETEEIKRDLEGDRDSVMMRYTIVPGSNAGLYLLLLCK